MIEVTSEQRDAVPDQALERVIDVWAAYYTERELLSDELADH